MRASLRVRRICLPWTAVVGSTGVLVTNALSAENLLLNILSVAFMLEADDLLGKLLLPNGAMQRVDALMEGMVDQKRWVTHRLISLSAATSMAFRVWSMNYWMNSAFFAENEDPDWRRAQELTQDELFDLPYVATPCSYLEGVQNAAAMILPMFQPLVESAGQLAEEIKARSAAEAIWLPVARTLPSYFFSMACTALGSLITTISFAFMTTYADAYLWPIMCASTGLFYSVLSVLCQCCLKRFDGRKRDAPRQ